MNTPVICSLHMPWDQLSCFLYRNSHKLQPIKGDRFCFLNTIELVLYSDYDDIVTLDDMVNNILDHVAAYASYYKVFHTGDIL